MVSGRSMKSPEAAMRKQRATYTRKWSNQLTVIKSDDTCFGAILTKTKSISAPSRVETSCDNDTYSRQDDLDAQINTIGDHRSSRPGRARGSVCGRNVLCNHFVN
ncbi:hypothetical protein CY34DRAFT_761193 [Suillus luteus UH-Slu-Lm8-n1]|uniref:Uncharacterized protein n=1 Tax=Suillus luteus UH-Slu-Lm8-n1 TaxID=930992 RepID=A0A0D0AUS1_9AGAM|nr:hypothetical protein CY34DRAFT_761193 [Suillus luteus UH-Slu-Lm8-n1]